MSRKANFPNRLKRNCEKIADQAQLGLIGTYYCLKSWKYFTIFAFSFLFFAYILTFFSTGTGNWDLISSGLSFNSKLSILGGILLETFTQIVTLSGVFVLLLAFLQGLSIMLMVYVWRHREKSIAIDGASTGSIATIIGFATLGCPTCGISLITPILTAIAGTSASILAERLGVALAIIAFTLIIYTVLRLGYTAFIIVTAKKYKEKHAKNN